MLNQGFLTKEFGRLLDRGMAKTTARELIQHAVPLLEEIVNYSCRAFSRCSGEAKSGPDTDVAVFVLFHQVIELTDGIAELTRAACARSSIPLARSLMESTLLLEYLLSDRVRFEERCRAWYVGYLSQQMMESERGDSETTKGLARIEEWELANLGSPPVTEPDNTRELLASALRQEHLLPLVEARRAWLQERKREPAWYSLVDKEGDLRALIKKHVPSRLPDYDVYYRSFAAMTHGATAEDVLTVEGKQLAFWKVRYPRDLGVIDALAGHFATSACKKVLDWYRPGESVGVRK